MRVVLGLNVTQPDLLNLAQRNLVLCPARMELVRKAEFSIVTRASKAWNSELIAAAGPDVTESYIANKRFFVGCRFPVRLAILDTTSGSIVTSLVTLTTLFLIRVGDRLGHWWRMSSRSSQQREPDHLRACGKNLVVAPSQPNS